MAELAPGSIRAEAGEEARARGLARVPVAAARAVFAETTRVPRALVHFNQGFNVDVISKELKKKKQPMQELITLVLMSISIRSKVDGQMLM